MASGDRRCAACPRDIGLWQNGFTSECHHTFHRGCVSGGSVCPACNARGSDAAPVSVVTASCLGFSSVNPPPSQLAPTSLFGRPLPPSSEPIGSTSLFGQATPATGRRNYFHPRIRPWSSCDICHSVIEDGQATFTSECHHTFHLRCFSGASVCPVCNARWHDTVALAVAPNPSPPPPTFFRGVPAPPHPFWHFGTVTELRVYDDDQPVEAPPVSGGGEDAQAAENNGVVVFKTHCEYPAVARSTSRDNFAVVIHVKAPSIAEEGAAAARAPLDLVTVLDVSASMTGGKLALLKRAMSFVIDKLGPDDRLSIVSFSGDARRVIRLTRMSDNGKASAKSGVESLVADGSTNILKGLLEAAKVLDDRRYRNAVASVILLSDGQDTHNLNNWGTSKKYNVLVPPSFNRDGERCVPVHTFGFGTDHDAAAMHTIAEETGGTFSFIENQAVVQDSFAQCIGGLLSVTVQEARIVITCSHPGVRVRSVKSGRYQSLVGADGRAASVDVGELYADEERRFLLFVDVPVAGAEEDVTDLIKVSGTYRDTATRQPMVMAGEDAVVLRPEEATNMEPSIEVERERFRVEATEDIAAAQEAAERGGHAAAAAILDRRQEALSRSTPGLAGDARCAALASELRELSARVADQREYEQTGRACLFAGMSSHAQQRATSVQLLGTAAPTPTPSGWSRSFQCAPGCAPPSSSFGAVGAYATPAMQRMVASSRKTREDGGSLNCPQ